MMKEISDNLKDLYNSLADVARTIPGFVLGSKEDVPYDITELANQYCSAVDNKDSRKEEQYLCALFIRYFYMIPLMYPKFKGYKLEIYDMAGWLHEGFNKAFKYRGWLDESQEVSKDPRGAEKCINQAITSVIQGHLKYFYQLKRRDELVTYSLDAMLAESSDHSNILAQDDAYKDELDCNSIISEFIKQGKIFEALIVDAICYRDTFTFDTKVISAGDPELETYTKVPRFSKPKLSHQLKYMTADEIEDFANKYEANITAVSKVVTKLSKLSRTCLSKKILDVLTKLSHAKEITALSC